MVWKAVDTMSLRLEFVKLASVENANVAELCRRFEISRKTGHKWLARFKEFGEVGLADQSRRPKSSPTASAEKMIEAVLELRVQHPAWGARKIQRRLCDLQYQNVPAISTVNGILKRHGMVDEEASRKARAFQRFEHDQPNDLWGMDFKGHFAMTNGLRCHPLTILDDHSRYAIGLRAMDNERGEPVKGHLTSIFRRYGLPRAMLMDNGSPWGTNQQGCFTRLEIWLMQLGIRVIHSRPHHPQTNGKDERFHRTLNVEVLQGRTFSGLSQTQTMFDAFRRIYNYERPHEGIELNVPASRYVASQRSFPEEIPAWDYGDHAFVRKIDASNRIYFQGQKFRISKGLRGHYVALDATTDDGVYRVRFRNTTLKTITLNK